jgi:hypothetical protein
MSEASVNKAPEAKTQIRCHCNRVFKDSTAIEQHWRDTKPHKPKNPNSTPKPDTLMRCSCGRGFKSEQALQQHKSMSPRHPRKGSIARADTKASGARENMKDINDFKATEAGSTTADISNLPRDEGHRDEDNVSVQNNANN